MSQPAPTKPASNFGFAQNSELWLSATFLMTLMVLIVPLPTFLLDMFLAANLALAIMLLLFTLNARRPLDVSVFPSLLLLMTLFRLALNVATTRLILLDGDAGVLVKAFGDLVVGGNLIVGGVVFLILVTIQFIVITKGATRISEVNARFTLDSLPGKQMAIDAELSVGAIDEVEARRRRNDLAAESEFFGAMDGASKYVRGDAIAGLVIMAVNVIGGILLGISQGQEIADAATMYSLLTIGDGLVSQIPALIIAASAGVLVTKSNSDSNLGQEINKQFSSGRRAMFTGGVVFFVIAFVPGFPMIPFLLLSATAFVFGYFSVVAGTSEDDTEAENDSQVAEEEPASANEQHMNQFLQRDRVSVEVGAGLINLVEPKNGKGIVDRISSLRRDIGAQFGFWIPKIRIKDNLKIDVQAYQFKIHGRVVGRGELRPRDCLAINPGTVISEIEGIATKDPAFDLDAKWITEANRRRAEGSGYTVVDAATVLSTHLGECIKRHAFELLNREDLKLMLDKLGESSPTIVEEVKPDGFSMSILHQVVTGLLTESVSISSLEQIIESASNHFRNAESIEALIDRVRMDIGATIVERFRDESDHVHVIVLEPGLEHELRQSVQENMITLDPMVLANLVEQIKTNWELASMQGQAPAVLVDGSIRRALRKTLRRSLPQVSVISYLEVPIELRISPVVWLKHAEVYQTQADHPMQNNSAPLPNPKQEPVS